MGGAPDNIPRSSFTEDADRFTSAYKLRKNDFRVGTIGIKICEWSHVNGYKRTSPPLASDWDTDTPSSFEPGSLVIKTSSQIRDVDLTVTLTIRRVGTQGLFTTDQSIQGKTYRDEVFTDGGTSTLNFTIPADSRPSLSIFENFPNTVWDVSNVVVTGSKAGDSFEVYILQGNNSRLYYGYNWDNIMTALEDTVLSRWVGLRRCPTCDGNGQYNIIDNSTGTCSLCEGTGVYLTYTCWNCGGDGTTCPTCDGYGLHERTTKGLGLYNQGKRYGVFKKNSAETDDYHRDRIQSRSWWVTPVEDEIIEFFGKAANVPDSLMKLVVREDMHEPCWYMFIPIFHGPHAFWTFEDGDALEYVEFAESVTPLGVNYIIGWYEDVNNRDPDGIEIDLDDRGMKKLARDVVGSYLEHSHFNNSCINDYLNEVFIVAYEEPVGNRQLMFFDWETNNELNDWTALAGVLGDYSRDNTLQYTNNWSLAKAAGGAAATIWCPSERVVRGKITCFVRPTQLNEEIDIFVYLDVQVPFVNLPLAAAGIIFTNTGIIQYPDPVGVGVNLTYHDGTAVVNYDYEVDRWYKVDMKWDLNQNIAWIKITDTEDFNKVGIVSRTMLWRPAGGVQGYQTAAVINGSDGAVFNLDRLSLSKLTSIDERGF